MAKARELDRTARWGNIGMIVAMVGTIAAQALQLRDGASSVWLSVALIAACTVVLVIYLWRLIRAGRHDDD